MLLCDVLKNNNMYKDEFNINITLGSRRNTYYACLSVNLSTFILKESNEIVFNKKDFNFRFPILSDIKTNKIIRQDKGYSYKGKLYKNSYYIFSITSEDDITGSYLVEFENDLFTLTKRI